MAPLPIRDQLTAALTANSLTKAVQIRFICLIGLSANIYIFPTELSRQINTFPTEHYIQTLRLFCHSRWSHITLYYYYTSLTGGIRFLQGCLSAKKCVILQVIVLSNKTEAKRHVKHQTHTTRQRHHHRHTDDAHRSRHHLDDTLRLGGFACRHRRRYRPDSIVSLQRTTVKPLYASSSSGSRYHAEFHHDILRKRHSRTCAIPLLELRRADMDSRYDATPRRHKRRQSVQPAYHHSARSRTNPDSNRSLDGDYALGYVYRMLGLGTADTVSDESESQATRTKRQKQLTQNDTI